MSVLWIVIGTCRMQIITLLLIFLPSRGPFVPLATMTATSWRSTPPSTPPRRSWRPCRRWYPRLSAPSNTSPIGWIRPAVPPTTTSTAKQQTDPRRTALAISQVKKRKNPAAATGKQWCNTDFNLLGYFSAEGNGSPEPLDVACLPAGTVFHYYLRFYVNKELSVKGLVACQNGVFNNLLKNGLLRLITSCVVLFVNVFVNELNVLNIRRFIQSLSVKQGCQHRWRALWSDKGRSCGQRAPDQRWHGPGAGADVQRQTHTDTAGHCLLQFTRTDPG